MVFKPFSTLARRSTKAFTHGYAQSLAAASQSSYASTQTPLSQFNHNRIGKPSIKCKESFHTNALHSSAITRPSTHVIEVHQEASLDQYISAWQKQHPNDEWQQYPNSKKIGWLHAAGFPARLLEGDLRLGSVAESITTKRGHSIPTIQEIKIQDSAIEEVTLEQVNEAIDQEIQDINDTAKKLSDSTSTPSKIPIVAVDTSVKITPSFVSSDIKKTKSDTDSELTAFYNNAVEHISSLEAAGDFAQIPAVFSEIHRLGLVAPANTYNSLVLSAIRLSDSASQVVPKALDIYTDMLRRNVKPNDVTYIRLLELLCLKALEVGEIKSSLARNKIRFQLPSMPAGFLLRSRETEQAIANEDDSLALAIKFFELSTSQSVTPEFPASVYRLMVQACAESGENDQMIRTCSQMESRKVISFASSYPAMIQAFARAGDLGSAVVCYNEYRDLAMADNLGNLSLINRADADVYAAVVRAYLLCNRKDGAEEFIGKILISLQDPGNEEQLQHVRDTIMIDGLVRQSLVSNDVSGALKVIERPSISQNKREQAIASIIINAADNGQADVVSKLYDQISMQKLSRSAAVAILALHLRLSDLSSARIIWSSLMSMQSLGRDMIEPTIAYSIALIDAGQVNESLVQARASFKNLRSAITAPKEQRDATDLIDESIELIGQQMAKRGSIPSAQGSMSFIWAMVENGGLLTPVVEQLLAGLGPNEITNLSWDDLKLVTQIEAGIVEKGNSPLDVAHFARFAHILQTITSSQMPVDGRIVELVDSALSKYASRNPELVILWNTYVRPQPVERFIPRTRKVQARTPTDYEPYDPYANTLDQRGSSILVEELEKQGHSSASSLHEALSRFRNIRRIGRHPRYIAYAKLIAAAAKEGRTNLMNEVFEMAKHDMPLLPQYPVVKHGWTTILDSMIGACLTLGNRALATEYHRQLLEIGSAPSANTFGLYITTLKESTKTFDEATEAVKIFLRAKAEGVEPTSFLYNALIGKLGKARRIDDCLFYFGEMRAHGVRPTSVTYGTIVNALCRVSDERFAGELFDEMESMSNYKPRAAPYNSMMQFLLNTKRDSAKVLEYYKRMQARNIQPTMHTYKLLIDTYATLEPINLDAAEGILDTIRRAGQQPEAVHFSSLIHAKGCVLHDLAGARRIFDSVIGLVKIQPKAGLYQALFESFVANHAMEETDALLQDMSMRKVEMTPYIANTLIHGWATEGNIEKAKAAYDSISMEGREPSTYEAMTRAYLVAEKRQEASEVMKEMLSRGYPSAVTGKVLELLGHGGERLLGATPSPA